MDNFEDKFISQKSEPPPNVRPTVILFYYSSMRSHLLYAGILENYPQLFDCVVEMPAIPHSRTSGKKSIKKIFKTLIDAPNFFLMSFLTIKGFSFLADIFKTSIKSICFNNKIEHVYFTKIDSQLLAFIEARKPLWIISSTSTLLTSDFLNIPLNGVINFHEAPLPNYRGSASYFWFMFNKEKYAHVTLHYVVEELDAGDIIFEGKEVSISTSSVFDTWFNMLKSHEQSWEYLLPYLTNGLPIPSSPQTNGAAFTYGYPNKSSIQRLKKRDISFVGFNDIKNLIRLAKNG